MIVKTHAIVLNRIPYSDSAFIVHLFTAQLGRQAVMVKGSRNRNSRMRIALFQPLALIECEIDFKETRSLHSLREVNIEKPFQQLNSDMARCSVALFVCEVLMRSIREEGPQEDLFGFLHRMVLHLDNSSQSVANFPLFFALKLLPYLGFKPGDNYSEHTPFFNIREGLFMPVFTTDSDTVSLEESQILYRMMQTDENNYWQLPLLRNQRSLLTQKISDYYAIHLANFGGLKSLPVLHDVFNL